MSTTSPSLVRPVQRIPRSVTISSWAVPVMVLGQFALLSGIPVVIALVGALRHVRDRTVQWAAGLVALSYVVPLVIWRTRPDGAESLSKDIHPVFVGLIVAASAALIFATHRARRR
ncbi:hypothetical protein [Spirillospora sp. CA-294931]|uniref:hypothetical protein n=1 Tax=Spirillospora sp. CA-294931 TaxID=3240042 RepID=UPI003D906A69